MIIQDKDKASCGVVADKERVRERQKESQRERVTKRESEK